MESKANESTLMKEKVVKLFRENTDMMGTDIADKLGVTRQYVAKVLTEAGENSMQRQKDITELRYQKLEKEYIDLFSEELTMDEMAEMLGVTPSVVAKISKRTNLRFRTLADLRKRNRVKEIEDLREQGLTLREVAGELGITIGYVTRMVRWGRDNEEDTTTPHETVHKQGTDEDEVGVTQEEKVNEQLEEQEDMGTEGEDIGDSDAEDADDSDPKNPGEHAEETNQ